MQWMSTPLALLLMAITAGGAMAQGYYGSGLPAPGNPTRAAARMADDTAARGSGGGEPSKRWFERGDCAPGTMAIGEPAGPSITRVQPVMPLMPQMPSRCVGSQGGRY